MIAWANTIGRQFIAIATLGVLLAGIVSTITPPKLLAQTTIPLGCPGGPAGPVPPTANYPCPGGGSVVNGVFRIPIGCPGGPIGPVPSTANYPCPGGGAIVNGIYVTSPGLVGRIQGRVTFNANGATGPCMNSTVTVTRTQSGPPTSPGDTSATTGVTGEFVLGNVSIGPGQVVLVMDECRSEDGKLYKGRSNPITVQANGIADGSFAVSEAVVQADDKWCTNTGSTELSWIMCPLINVGAEFAEKLDCQILSLIKLNTVNIFHEGGVATGPVCGQQDLANQPDENSRKSSEAYHKIWGAFRNIALAILVILGLIMVASQIIGLDIFDAYTIRKMLPKLIIATIFMTLSWDIMEFVYNAANASADAVLAILKIPFQNFGDANIGQTDLPLHEYLLGNSIVAILLSVATAGAGAIAIITFLSTGGLLALVASLALAILSVWVLLVARDVVATLLVVFAPIAIMCSAYEPFEKLFKFWKTFLIALLISIPAVALVLGISQAAALIAVINDNEFVGLIILIAGFALLWGIVMQLDKATGFFGNALSKVTGRAQKFLSDYRGNVAKRNFGLWRQGSLNTALGKRTRGLGLAVGAAQASTQATGTGAISSFRKARRDIARQGVDNEMADEMLKRDKGRYAGYDEINEEHSRLGVGATRAQLAEALVAREAKAGRTLSLEDAKRRVAEYEQSFGGQVGTTQMVLAATKAAANSSTAYREERDKNGKIYRTTDEAIQSLRDSLNRLVDNKSITLTQAAAIMTNNKTRLDLAGAGFAATMGFIGSKGEARDLQAFKDSFVSGNNAYSLYGQRWETARAGAQHMKSQLDDLLAARKTEENLQKAQESGAPQQVILELQKTFTEQKEALAKRKLLEDRNGNALDLKQAESRLLAEIDSGYQVAKNLAPLNAQWLSDTLLSYKSPNSDKPVNQMIIEKKRTDPEMEKYGYEFYGPTSQPGTQPGQQPVNPNLIIPGAPPPGAPGAHPPQAGGPG